MSQVNARAFGNISSSTTALLCSTYVQRYLPCALRTSATSPVTGENKHISGVMATTSNGPPTIQPASGNATTANLLRPSTLEGATTYCPREALDRIADRYNTSVSKLVTLTVKPNASLLYDAILAYAPLSDGPDPMSLLVRTVVEDSDEVQTEVAVAMARTRQEDMLSGGSGLRHKKAPEPKIELGTSECCVQWPPKSSAKKRKVADDAVESFDVHLVHYVVGDAKMGFNCMRCWNEIVAVCVRRDLLVRFTREVLEWHHQEKQQSMTEQSFQFYRFRVMHERGRWESEGRKRGRQIDSVILQDGQIESIISDVEKFMSVESRQFYLKHGLPHRRSYLLYGPPGTGKTSTIRVIAGQFGLNCCYLSVANKDFSNQLLGDALRKIPSNALIVLEDVDALFKGRVSEQASSLTFSGLLNALDGLLSADGTLVVMTTNHLEKLDPALIRGGRVDRTFKFDHPDDKQLQRLFKSFYPDSQDDVPVEFAKRIRARKEKQAGSMATLQQFFIDCREKGAEESVNEVDSFFESHVPEEDRN